MKKILDNPIRISFFVLLVLGSVIVYTSHVKYGYTDSFIENVLVEAHGMIFDILVVGIILFYLTSVGEKNREIKAYLEQIDDFRYWKSDESKYRIFGIVKRLPKLKYTKFDFSECDLSSLPLVGDYRQSVFNSTNLERSDLGNAMITDCLFENIDLRSTILPKEIGKATIKKSNLSNYHFRNITFVDVLFEDVMFDSSVFENCKFNNTVFKNVVLKESAFTDCDLSGTMFYLATLEGNNDFINCNLNNVKVKIDGWRFISRFESVIRNHREVLKAYQFSELYSNKTGYVGLISIREK